LNNGVGQSGSAQLIRQILATADLQAPDGRPLHAYPVTPGQTEALRRAVRTRFLEGNQNLAAAAFVFWAAEDFRARFPEGDRRRWDFLFAGLGVPRPDDTVLDPIVNLGLTWWKREVRRSAAGRQMRVYTLMAEGGLPQKLLAQEGLYRRVVLGLLGEIETERAVHSPGPADRIAWRWIEALPQTFRNEDISALLAELGRALGRLREELPDDLSGMAAEHWLNQHHPGWGTELPLRMSAEVAEQLIRPALAAARERPVVSGPLATRELRRDHAGRWHWYLRLQDAGFLPKALLRDAADLRLRLLPEGTAASGSGALIYSATPEPDGWQLRRIGGSGAASFQFRPDLPFILGAFADGRRMGEVLISPSLPSLADEPSFWRAADPSEGETAARLVMQSGSGRTRAACLWLAAAETDEVAGAEGVTVDGSQFTDGGRVWRISGHGLLKVGVRHRFNIVTLAAHEAPDARLVPVGAILPGWRTERDRGPVYLGTPQIFGEIGAAGLRQLPPRALRLARGTGRVLGEHVVEWIESGEMLARLRLICLPKTVRISLQETTGGGAALSAQGLPLRLRLALQVDQTEEAMVVTGDVERVALAAPSVPPGELSLRLSDIDAGTALRLIAPWPARSGLILDPGGKRLDRYQPIATDGLRGWRAVVPEGYHGDLVLRLEDHIRVALPIAGEMPLYSQLPLIRAMLAQSGPDAQVNLHVVVNGREGRRLEIRRYDDHAVVEGDRLRPGLPRDKPVAPETALGLQIDQRLVRLHAVDLTAPEHPIVIEATANRDLRVLLGEKGGPWLIQSRLGARVQRAVVWAPSRLPWSSREQRITRYAQEWQRLAATPDDPDWQRLWRLIIGVGQGGDAGVADQVQALAIVPEAVVMLLLRVPLAEVPTVLGLDVAAPLFWPVLHVRAFEAAIAVDYTRRCRDLTATGFGPSEAGGEARTALERKVESISRSDRNWQGISAPLSFVRGSQKSPSD
jgi:hypothetical protein